MPDPVDGRSRTPCPGQWSRIWLVLIAAGCLVLVASAPLPHTDADALFYGKIAKNILASGDWLTLRYQQRAELVDVPPLTIWLMAASLRLGGDTAAALRLWHLLMTVALVVVTYRIARLAGGEEESLLAALLLLSTQQVFVWSLAPKQDIPMTLFLTLALYDYLGYRRDGRAGPAVRAGIWVGLAVLSKGIAALGAFALIAGADVLVAWRLSAREHWRWTHVAAAATAFLATAAPWFIYGAVHQGAGFVQLYFLQHSTAWRFFRAYGTPLPYWVGLLIYAPLLMIGMLPWTGLLPGTVREGWRGIRDRVPVPRLCAVWVVVVLAALSLSTGTKSIRYLLPIYPPLAVLAGSFLTRIVDIPRGLRTAAATLFLIWIPPMVAVAGWGVGRDLPEFHIYLPMAAVFTLAVVGFGLVVLWEHGRLAVALLATGTLLAYASLSWAIAREYERLWPWRAMSAQISRLYHPGDRVLLVGQAREEHNFINYFLDGPAMAETDEANLKALWGEAPRVMALLSPQADRSLRASLRPVVLMTTAAGWVLVTNR